MTTTNVSLWAFVWQLLHFTSRPLGKWSWELALSTWKKNPKRVCAVFPQLRAVHASKTRLARRLTGDLIYVSVEGKNTFGFCFLHQISVFMLVPDEESSEYGRMFDLRRQSKKMMLCRVFAGWDPFVMVAKKKKKAMRSFKATERLVWINLRDDVGKQLYLMSALLTNNHENQDGFPLNSSLCEGLIWNEIHTDSRGDIKQLHLYGFEPSKLYSFYSVLSEIL